jgi:hypothetical protein
MSLSKEQLGKLSTFYKQLTPSSLTTGYELSSGENPTYFNEIIKVLIDIYDEGALSGAQIIKSFRNLIQKDNPYDESDREFHKLIQIYYDGPELTDDLPYNSKMSAILNKKTSEAANSVSLVAILSNTSRISQAVRNVNDISLFMNAIPTLEFSRCVPFLDVKFQIPGSPLNEDGKLQILSMMKFLIGAEQFGSKETVNKNLANGNEFKKTIVNGKTITTSQAGMELFLMPQTFVNADFVDNSGNSALRATPIIDTFRPFMSLDSLEIDVAPTIGLFSYKTAKLNLTLHDRSRLAEISQIIKPEVYTSTRFFITYGWSHPEGIESNNVYGSFLNKMRTTELFGIKNASFSFDAVGQVKIIAELFTIGANEMAAVQIAESESYKNTQKQIDEIASVVSQLRDKLGLRSLPGGKEIRVYQLMDGAEKGVLPKLEGDDLKELKKLITDLRKDKSSLKGQELANKLEALFGKGNDDGLKKQLENTVSSYISEKIDRLMTGDDPFLKPDSIFKKDLDAFNKESDVVANPKSDIKSGTPAAYKKKNVNRLVSFGKLMLIFVGEALQSMTNVVEEVQFVFYKFNNNAGRIGGRNIAEFPIEISYFNEIFTSYAQQKNNINLPLGEFTKLMNDAVLNDTRALGYGFRDLYVKRTSIEKQAETKPKITEKEIADRQSEITSKYGGLFKQPVLEFFIECLPKHADKADKDLSVNSNKTTNDSIMRIHIFDKQDSPHSPFQQLIKADAGIQNIIKSGFQDAAGPSAAENKYFMKDALDALSIVPNKSLDGTGIKLFTAENGTLKINGKTEEIKNFIKHVVPTIEYGTNGSAIYNISVTSLQDQLLSTVNMLRAGKGSFVQPNNSGVGGIPLRVIPAQMDISCMGCPLFSVNQQFFIDMRTGTTIDNIYLITGLSHTISAGKFESRLKLSPLDAYGAYESVADKVKQLTDLLKQANKSDSTSPSTSGAGGGGKGSSGGGGFGGGSTSGGRPGG